MIHDRGSAKTEPKSFPALDAMVIAGLWVGVGLGQVWVFGVLFVFWAIRDIISRRTHMIGDVALSEHPILFWVIAGSWLVFGILSFWA